jgi:hypothetical protein
VRDRIRTRDPSSNSKGKTQISESCGAESGARGNDSAPETVPETTPDPELAAVVRAWPTLPEPIRAGILAMVNATKGESHAE